MEHHLALPISAKCFGQFPAIRLLQQFLDIHLVWAFVCLLDKSTSRKTKSTKVCMLLISIGKKLLHSVWSCYGVNLGRLKKAIQECRVLDSKLLNNKRLTHIIEFGFFKA